MIKKLKSGTFVFRLRKLSTLTQGKFADKIKVGRSYISQLENNNVDISLSTFIDWCKLFEINPTDIFEEKKWK
jgi:transcriptional regulator with XRE-family HTH domain